MAFLNKIVPDFVKRIPCHMDFDGQRRAEKTFQVIILLFAAVGFVWGYICQQFSQTFYILAAGFLLSCLVTLPPWPIYRHKPLKWQPARNYDESGEENQPQSSPAISKSKKKRSS